MSLSNPTTNSNPASKFIEWTGKEGKFQYYNKGTGETIDIPVPIYIIPLDQLSTITGYNPKSEKGIYSNEVHNLSNQSLDVRYHGGDQVSKGLYADIKKELSYVNARFAKSVYAAMISSNGKELELVNLKFYGSSLGPWIDAKIGDSGNVIILDRNPESKKKGDTVYYEPTVVKSEVREDIIERAKEMDNELQDYLKGASESSSSTPPAQKEIEADMTDDLPF